MPPLEDEILAMRSSVAVSRMDHVCQVRITGERAYEALDRIVAADLRIRDGQLIHSLFLDEEAHPFADVFIASDEDEFLILAEGPRPEALLSYVRRHLGSGAEVEDRSAENAVVSLDGPYAWELLSLVAGGDVVGLPYLTHFRFDRGICYRAGKTGEYGYGLIVPREQVEDLSRLLLERGSDLDVREAGLEALDRCALENSYFNIRREGREPLTPIELQLQWRVSYEKPYVGSEALSRARREGVRRRVTWLLAEGAVPEGGDIRLRGRSVGRVVNAGHSIGSESIALGLIDLEWAHPGVPALQITENGTPCCARSITPPLWNNRSLFVSPQIHSYATRHEFPFPPLARA